MLGLLQAGRQQVCGIRGLDDRGHDGPAGGRGLSPIHGILHPMLLLLLLLVLLLLLRLLPLLGRRLANHFIQDISFIQDLVILCRIWRCVQDAVILRMFWTREFYSGHGRVIQGKTYYLGPACCIQDLGILFTTQVLYSGRPHFIQDAHAYTDNTPKHSYTRPVYGLVLESTVCVSLLELLCRLCLTRGHVRATQGEGIGLVGRVCHHFLSQNAAMVFSDLGFRHCLT